MGLVDILNKFPLKACSKLVEKTGISKYSYAQAANIAGTLPAAWCAIEGYQNGSTLAMVVGGLIGAFNGLYTLTNPKRKEHEKPGYLEDTVSELHGNHPDIPEQDIKEHLEAQLAKAEYMEDKMQRSGLFQGLTGKGLVIMAAMGYFQANGDLSSDLGHHAVYAFTIGLSSWFTGVSHYFRACRPKRQNKGEE